MTTTTRTPRPVPTASGTYGAPGTSRTSGISGTSPASGTSGTSPASGTSGTSGTFGAPAHPSYPAASTVGVGVAARDRGRFGREMAYLLSGLPLGIVAFALTVAGFAAGVSTLVIVLGLPVLAGTLSMARYFARVEADQVLAVTGRPLAPLAHRPTEGRWSAVRDPQAWRDLVHAVVAFPVRVVTFAFAVSWTLGGVAGLCYGLWSWSVPRDGNDGLLDLAFGYSGTGPDIAFNTAVGVLLLATAVPVVRGLVTAQAGLARILLCSRVR